MIPAYSTIAYEARPVVTWATLGLCIATFFYEVSLSEADLARFFETYGLVPARFTSSAWGAGALLSFVSCMFLHGGLLHIASNLWVLWVLGPAIEDRLGPSRFAVLYLFSGLAAGILHVITNWGSAIPTVGASGAIAGVIAAYARRFPYAWVNILQPIGFIPAFFMMPVLAFAALWFMTQVGQGFSAALAPATGGGVAWWAHVGGFIAGWMLVKRLAPPADPAREMQVATASFFWPMQVWAKWMRWMTSAWWRR